MAGTNDECTCTDRGDATQYWKLTCTKHTTAIEAKELMPPSFCPTSAKKDKSLTLLHRYERGLLSYERYTKAELQVFINGRGLQQGIPKSGPKKDLVARLERADDSVTFDRFGDLAPEIRLRIYELHFRSLPPMTTPVQPPITTTARLVREESLPVFFDTCRFSFASWYSEPYGDPKLLVESSRRFLDRLDNDNQLAGVKKLELSFVRQVYWHVDLPTANGSWQVRRTKDGPIGPLTQYGVENTNLRLETIIKEMNDQPAPRKLQRADVDILAGALEW